MLLSIMTFIEGIVLLHLSLLETKNFTI